jgi:hypothetical protein
MANRKTQLSSGCKKLTLDTTATGASAIELTDGDNEVASSLRFQVVPGGAAPGSIVVRTRIRGSSLTNTDLASPIVYRDSTDTAIASGGSITAADVYTVITDQLEALVEYTSGADGMTLYYWPMKG